MGVVKWGCKWQFLKLAYVSSGSKGRLVKEVSKEFSMSLELAESWESSRRDLRHFARWWFRVVRKKVWIVSSMGMGGLMVSEVISREAMSTEEYCSDVITVPEGFIMRWGGECWAISLSLDWIAERRSWVRREIRLWKSVAIWIEDEEEEEEEHEGGGAGIQWEKKFGTVEVLKCWIDCWYCFETELVNWSLARTFASNILLFTGLRRTSWVGCVVVGLPLFHSFQESARVCEFARQEIFKFLMLDKFISLGSCGLQ